MIRQGKSASCVHLSEMQAYVRIENGDEEALLAGLVRTAGEMCEEFINQALLVRTFEQDLVAKGDWTLVGIQPVRAITSIRMAGSTEMLQAGTYRADIDHDGRAFIRGLPRHQPLVVAGLAGLATDSNDVPEPVRQGIMRLAASLFSNRDNMTGELPAAVTGLWRPYRRAGLCR